jgi:Ca2+-binding EF-hand superfamily protein
MVRIGFPICLLSGCLQAGMCLVCIILLADAGMAAEDARVEKARKTFSILDIDDDQKVTYVEFANMKIDGFMAHDRNKDNYLTQDEVLITPEEFGKLDRNGDGKVSGGEFIDSRYGQFEPYDANKNGEIDLQEFTRVLVTIDFRLLYCLIVLDHGRRRLVHYAVTAHPTDEWIARQIVGAFPWEEAPTFLVRDHDAAYSAIVKRRLRGLGIRDRPTAPRSPWQNGHVERLIGSIRRECLDHMMCSASRTSAGS